ncbi:E3 ubiquitin-protein ligase ubr11, partial [Metarhizium brunneum ARSEF 3297]
MLAAVFTAGFAFEVYGPHPDKWRTGIRQLLTSRYSGFNNGVNKWWDNHNRGRQWKDIRSKYVEETAEDDE